MNIMDKFSLKGKKAIVTGGARGLNHGMAEGLHEAGAEVVLFDIMDLVYESAEKMSTPEAPVHAVKGDVTNKESREKAFAKAIELLGGRLDILINGAGIQYRCEAIDFPEDKFKQILDVNLVGLFYMAQLAAKVMIPQGYGHIVNIGSLSTIFGASMIAGYTASKGGVGQVTKVMSTEWAGHGIKVNCICPGYMATDLTKDIATKNPTQYANINARLPIGRWGTSDDLKGAVVFLSSDASDYISGTALVIDGGYTVK